MVNEEQPQWNLRVVVVVSPKVVHLGVSRASVELQNGQNHEHYQLHSCDYGHENISLGLPD